MPLGIGVRSVDYLISTKQLECRPLGGRMLVPVKEVERFAASNHYDSVTAALGA